MNASSKEARAIFVQAVKLDSAQWAAFLAEHCRENADLRQQVMNLLQANQEAGSFLNAPAIAPPATFDQPPITERAGTVIGHYKLLEQIGEGGFGVVFMAEQTEPVKRKVALKILKPGMDTKQVVARFEAERQALAVMDHPNIAKVLDAGATESGRPYFAMELVKGSPMTQFCDDNRLDTRRRLELFAQVCQAVQHAHQKGIIHRDIKPSNVIVSSHDGKPVVKVIDFGIAKAMSGQLTDKTLFTGFAQMIGTPLYMSPEQAGMSDLDVDTRSDIYSLGVLMYELLTGLTPFDKERLKNATYDEIRRIIREEEPPRPSARISTMGQVATTMSERRNSNPRRLNQSLRGELDWIVMKALEKDRKRRYESVSAFGADVERHLNDEPVHACPPSVWYQFRKFARRNKGSFAIAMVTLLFISTVAGAIGWMVRDRTARQARVVAKADEILDDAERLMHERQWLNALATVKRAEPLIATIESNEETQRRLRRLLANLVLIQRLEEARLLESQLLDRSLNFARAEKDYARAFAHAGLKIDGVTVQQAAQQMRSRSGIAIEIASALTDWARLRRLTSSGPGDAGWRRLLDIADAVDADPWRRRIRAAMKQNDGGAKSLLELAESIDVGQLPPSSVIILGRLLRDHVSADQAVKFLLHSLHERPADFWINFEAAVCLTESTPTRLDEAVAYYRAALALRPDSAPVLCNLGAALCEQRKPDEAIVWVRKAIKRNPRNSYAHYMLAVVHDEKNQLEKAIHYYQEAIRLHPKSDKSRIGTYYFALGIAYLGLADRHPDRWADAEKAFREAVNTKRDFPVYYALGRTLQYQKKTAEAAAAYRQAIELKDSFPKMRLIRRSNQSKEKLFADAYYHLGLIRLRQHKWQQAVTAFRDATINNPNHAKAFNELGVIFMEQIKDNAEAIVALRKATAIKPDYAMAHFNLGNALHSAKRHDEAVVSYNLALKYDPKYVKACNNLGLALMDQGKGAEAAAAWRQTLKIDPTFAWAHCNLATFYRRQGQFDASLKALQEGHRWGTKKPDWTIPTARLIREAKKLVQLQVRWERWRNHKTPAKANLLIRDRLTSKDSVDDVRRSSFHKVQIVQLEKGKVYSISLVSGDFDTYLRIEDAQKNVQAVNDDADEFLNSHLLFQPTRSGPIRLVVTTFQSKQKGIYFLSVDELAKSGLAKKIEGKLDARSPLFKGRYHNRYTVKLRGGHKYLLDLCSNSFDPYLAARNSQGEVVAEDDDGGDGLNARIFLMPDRDDTFEILAIALQPQMKGTFRLTMQEYRRAQAAEKIGTVPRP